MRRTRRMLSEKVDYHRQGGLTAGNELLEKADVESEGVHSIGV
jgi:hypothetical protein